MKVISILILSLILASCSSKKSADQPSATTTEKNLVTSEETSIPTACKLSPLVGKWKSKTSDMALEFYEECIYINHTCSSVGIFNHNKNVLSDSFNLTVNSLFPTAPSTCPEVGLNKCNYSFNDQTPNQVSLTCGKTTDTYMKDEANTSATPPAPFESLNPALSGSLGETMVTQVKTLKSSVACLNGGYRLTKDVSFYVSASALSGNKIGGVWQPGFLTNGVISKLWVGVSAYRDLMFVTQVSNGSQVVGFNTTISFCEMKSSNDLPSIISNERVLDSFQAPYGIILDSNTSCGYSVVDLAQNVSIISRRAAGNSYLPPDVQIPTSFTKPTCNGQF